MSRLIDARVAATVLLIGLAALAVFHILAMIGLVPADMVWGGRAEGNVFAMELSALLVALLFGLLVAVRTGDVVAPGLRRVARIGMWVMVVFFTLSIIGNLASTSSLERAIFTPLSVILAVMALRLALEKGDMRA